jgi:hypothetical protein
MMLSSVIKREDKEYLVRASELTSHPGKYGFRIEVAEENEFAEQTQCIGRYDTLEEALTEGIRQARDGASTWRELITEELKCRGESWADLVAITLSEEELEQEFLDQTWWGLFGKPFTAWSVNYVYFPVGTEDCREYVSSVPRNPNGEKTAHIGGYCEV